MSTSTDVVRGKDYTWSNSGFTWAAATFTWANAAEGDAYTMTNQDGLSLAEGRKINEVKREPVQIRFSVSVRSQMVLQRLFAEAVMVAAGLRAHVEKPLKEAVGTFSDEGLPAAETRAVETLAVSESEAHDAEFVRRLQEYLEVYVRLENEADKRNGEGISFDDNTFSAIGKDLQEDLTLIEKIRKTLTYQRLLSEALALSDSLKKATGITGSSHVTVDGSMLHHSRAIISDIIIGSAEVTADIPAGYSDFKRFMPGDYAYTKALVKLALEADMTSDRPMVETWTYNVDLPDIIKRGTESLAARNTTIDFDEAFYQVPEVTITMKGASGTVPVPNITAVTKEGFSVELRNTSGTLVAGTISWQAIGC